MTIIQDQAQDAKADLGQGSGSLLATVKYALAFAGADAGTITRATQVVAAGEVYDAATKAVRDQQNEGLTSFFDCLDVVVTRVASNQSLEPLFAAAKEIKAERAPSAQLGHFPWCMTDRCTTRHYDDGEPYTEHTGPRFDMPIPEGMHCEHGELLAAELCALEEFTGEPQISINSGGNGTLLDPAETDQVIADLTAFLDGLKQLRRSMDQERAQ
jgi:hypothetical protein